MFSYKPLLPLWSTGNGTGSGGLQLYTSFIQGWTGAVEEDRLGWMAGGSGKNLPKSSEQEKCKFSAKQDPLLPRTIFGFFFFHVLLEARR